MNVKGRLNQKKTSDQRRGVCVCVCISDYKQFAHVYRLTQNPKSQFRDREKRIIYRGVSKRAGRRTLRGIILD